MQEHYTVLKLRSSLLSTKAQYLRCRELQAVTMQSIMSDLPKKRLAYQSPPFTNTGVDYFRPYYVTVRRTTEKNWGFLLTCLTTRAVHVEMVTSMDTSTCVMGVERFVSRSGTPAMIWSDNGTNFIGADKEIPEKIRKLNVVNIAAELARKGIKRSLNPPSHHIKVVSVRGWYAVSSACCIPFLARVASRMRCCILPFVSWSMPSIRVL